MTLNDTGRYFFLELPDQFIPGSLADFITKLKGMNAIPIIAHPERNMAIQRDVMLLHDLITAGALSQITGGSLTGGFGPHALQCCLRIVALNLAHFMATDAHSPETRPPRLFRAAERLSTLTGKTGAERILFEGPAMVIEGKEPESVFYEIQAVNGFQNERGDFKMNERQICRVCEQDENDFRF